MNRKTSVNSAPFNPLLAGVLSVVSMVALSCVLLLGSASPTTAQSPTTSSAKARTFATADEAADALIAAAGQFDETALKEILGPDSYDIVHTGEPARDREMATEFAALASVKKDISLDPK